MWKEVFGASLIKLVEQKYGQNMATETQVYDFLRAQQQKYGIWAELAESLGILQNQAHNFYHNTWSRRFYPALEPFFPQLNELVQQHKKQTRCQQKAITAAKQEFLALHPGKEFHQSHLQQLLNRFYGKPLKQEPAQSEQLSSQVTVSLTADQLDVNDLKQYLKFGK